VRRAAAEALSEIGGAEAIQALMTMLKDPDPEIRKTVAEALGSKNR
jgi:HEAT repeat protein